MCPTVLGPLYLDSNMVCEVVNSFVRFLLRLCVVTCGVVEV